MKNTDKAPHVLRISLSTQYSSLSTHYSVLASTASFSLLAQEVFQRLVERLGFLQEEEMTGILDDLELR